MKVIYGKVILYAYAHLSAIAEQIDELVEKKAFSSYMDFSPALFQCESIINLTEQKKCVFALKLTADEVLKGFSESEKDCFDYKYFHFKPKEYYADFDASSRGYFRRQIRLADKFCERMEKAGYGDERFEKECLTMDFFREMLSRVKEKENMNRKNKSEKEKAQINSLKQKIARNLTDNGETREERACVSA